VPLLYDNPREVGPTASSTPWPRTPCTAAGRRRRLRHVHELRRGVAQGEFLGGRSRPASRSPSTPWRPGRRLFKVELVEPRSVIGKTTVEALQSGLLYGFAGQVDGMVRRDRVELGARPVVLATGGLSHLMFRVCETLDHHEPDLTLVGLRLVYERNV
jgi:type III pantothenate kinase